MPNILPSKKGLIQGTPDSSQAAARDEASGTHDDATGDEAIAVQWFRSSGRGGGTMRYVRTFLYFDTSGVTGTVASCQLRVEGGGSATNGDIIGVRSDAFGGDGGTDLHNDDFNNIAWSTAYTNQLETWDSSGANTFTLTSDALTDMKNNDYFIIALVEHDSDFQDTDTADGAWYVGINFGGAIQLSFILATGYGNAVNGVASANIGKINGAATADIDKVNGV